MKICTKCGIEKTEDAFEMQPSRGRRRSICRECRVIENKKWQAQRKLNPPQEIPETKQCNRCYEVKPMSEFSPNGAGYFRACCKSCNNRQHSAKGEEKRISEGRTWYQPFTNEQGILVRGCSRCREVKPVSEFYQYKKIHSRCKNCESEVQKTHRVANPEKYRVRSRTSARKHPETHKRWIAAHPKQRLQYRRKYRETHYEKVLADDRARNNEERKRSLNEAWRLRYQKNPHKHIDRINRYRARMLNAPMVESINRQAIFERDKWICYLCGQVCTPKNATLDHVIPLFHHGSHTADNLRVACRSCNSRKGYKLGGFLA